MVVKKDSLQIEGLAVVMDGPDTAVKDGLEVICCAFPNNRQPTMQRVVRWTAVMIYADFAYAQQT